MKWERLFTIPVLGRLFMRARVSFLLRRLESRFTNIENWQDGSITATTWGFEALRDYLLQGHVFLGPSQRDIIVYNPQLVALASTDILEIGLASIPFLEGVEEFTEVVDARPRLVYRSCLVFMSNSRMVIGPEWKPSHKEGKGVPRC